MSHAVFCHCFVVLCGILYLISTAGHTVSTSNWWCAKGVKPIYGPEVVWKNKFSHNWRDW